MAASAALDIVLLPTSAGADEAIRLSASIPGHPPFRLDREEYRPHLTLAMAYVLVEDMPTIAAELREVAQHFASVQLPASIRPAKDEQSFSWILLEATPEIVAFRDQAVEILRRHSSQPSAENEAFLLASKDEVVSEQFKNFTRQFLTTLDGPQYRPHITLGNDSPTEPLALPVLTFDRLALVHMGNYCTARELLATWPLGAK